MKTFHATFYDVPTIIDVFGNTAFKSNNNSRSNSGPNSRTTSTEHPSVNNTANTTVTNNGSIAATTTAANTITDVTSNATTTATKPNDLYSEVLVEASLFNEFLDTPPPKSLANKTSTTTSNNNVNSIVPPTAAITPSKGWMSSLISSFYNNPVTQENALVGFKPKELRPVQTQADVNRRLSNYHSKSAQHTQHTTNNKGSDFSHTTSNSSSEARGSGLAMEDYQQVESLISVTPIVLYYCSCLVSKMPGN